MLVSDLILHLQNVIYLRGDLEVYQNLPYAPIYAVSPRSGNMGEVKELRVRSKRESHTKTVGDSAAVGTGEFVFVI